MENKEVATVKKITVELVCGFIVYGIPFAILYSIVYSVISSIISSEALIIKAIIAIILQGIGVYFIWKFNIDSTFKKISISRNDVPAVMKNIMIFTIILCAINAIMNFSEVNQLVDETINSSASVKFSERFMRYTYTPEQMGQYEIEKQKAIKKTKAKLYIYLAVLEIGVSAVYLGAVPLQKDSILKYAV